MLPTTRHSKAAIGLAAVISATLGNGAHGQDLLGPSALAIAAFAEKAPDCGLDAGIGKMLRQIDEFFLKTRREAWRQARDAAPAYLTNAKNLGAMQGSSTCSVYVNMITYISPLYVAYLEHEAEIDASLTRLLAEQAAKTKEESQARKRREDCDPRSVAGINRQYNRKNGMPVSGPPCPGEENDEIARNPPPRNDPNRPADFGSGRSSPRTFR